VGGLSVQIVGWAQNDTPYPMVTALLILSALALGTIILRRTALRRIRVPPSKEEAAAGWPA
jgi:hypothetical protein